MATDLEKKLRTLSKRISLGTIKGQKSPGECVHLINICYRNSFSEWITKVYHAGSNFTFYEGINMHRQVSNILDEINALPKTICSGERKYERTPLDCNPQRELEKIVKILLKTRQPRALRDLEKRDGIYFDRQSQREVQVIPIGEPKIINLYDAYLSDKVLRESSTGNDANSYFIIDFTSTRSNGWDSSLHESTSSSQNRYVVQYFKAKRK